ncbi:MAG: phosphatidate cytidylyltransferase [Candidatus Gastranaerophilales bacterium]|nr:phosphatidate cytidylyltransferase [Candidatus Gastranaerophilales bacterium]
MSNADSVVKMALCVIFCVLFLSHIFVLILAKIKSDKDFSNLKLRMRSWWLIILFLVPIFLCSKIVGLIMSGLISFLALKEYFSFIRFEPADRKLLFWAYFSIPAQLCFLCVDWIIMFYLFVPLYMFLIIPLRRILAGRTDNFIKVTSLIQWGVMLNVYALGYIGAFLILPFNNVPAIHDVSGVRLLLFLLVLNALNDASQYVWGKLFGKKPIVPNVSPHKTWAGFVGGVITTTILSVLLAPYLTPMDLKFSIFAGLLIGISGFIGDVVLSAVKRDAGVKDSSNLIPGHGGILDRVDSLTYTAPIFFHFFCYFFQKGM